MKSYKKGFVLLVVTLSLFFALPQIALALETTPLADGDIEINRDNFDDIEMYFWAIEQPWADDGILSRAEAEGITWLNLHRIGVEELSTLRYFPNVTFLDCSDNYLSEIDLTYNPKLQTLDCQKNERLTNIIIPDNSALASLYCMMGNLTSLDLSGASALKRIDYSGNRITSIDLSNNPQLEALTCMGNGITTLDLSHSPNLTQLNIGGNQIKPLDLSHNPRLGTLYCAYSGLTSIDLSHNPELMQISLSHNNLTYLDLSNNNELYDLPGYWYYDQTTNATSFTSDNTNYYVDMATLIPNEYLKNIKDVQGGSLNRTTNLVLLDDPSAPSISYTYVVKENREETPGVIVDGRSMQVTVNLTTGSATKATIHFDSAGGSLINRITIDKASTLQAPKDPTKDGHRFLGWHLMDEEGNTCPKLLFNPYIFTFYTQNPHIMVY